VIAASLREFVADAPAGDDSVAAAALEALSAAFTTAEETGTTTDRLTWLDTFDWRLYRAGLMLRFEQARRGGRLVLSRTDGTQQAEQPVASWPRRPTSPARRSRSPSTASPPISSTCR